MNPPRLQEEWKNHRAPDRRNPGPGVIQRWEWARRSAWIHFSSRSWLEFLSATLRGESWNGMEAELLPLGARVPTVRRRESVMALRWHTTAPVPELLFERKHCG